MQRHDRSFDIILMGATGFTGSLVAAHLESAAAGLSWGIAGRNDEKLQRIVQTVAPSARYLIADSLSETDMSNIARQAKVVISTAGPFAQIGTPLVAACVQHGTDYVDITGETQWVRQMVDTYQDAAEASGARIVHCCGFDSIPSDLGVMRLAHSLRSTATHIEILGLITRLKGGLSGGTLASMQNVLKAAKDRSVARVLRHPFSLNPRPLPDLREPPDQLDEAYVPELETWTAPFVMAAINTRVVRRSEALRGFEPTALHYHESVRAKSKLKAVAAATSIKAGVVSQAFAPTRAVSKLFLPRPGDGPSEAERQAGCFEMTLYGRARGSTMYTHRMTVSADSDPGYSATAKMLGESALCALETQTEMGGIHTPATAFGDALIRRLESVGIYINLETLTT